MIDCLFDLSMLFTFTVYSIISHSIASYTFIGYSLLLDRSLVRVFVEKSNNSCNALNVMKVSFHQYFKLALKMYVTVIYSIQYMLC